MVRFIGKSLAAAIASLEKGGSPVLRRLTYTLGILQLSLVIAAPAGASGVCSLGAIQSGDPIAPNNTSLNPFVCRASGEIFVARDTLIQAITVWRSAQRSNDVTPWQLFILGVGTINSIDYPDIFRTLLTGPVLVNQFGDGVHPVEFRFAFDPPFALPASGKYFFCLKETTGFSSLLIVADTTNSYPEGQAWAVGPTVDCQGFGDTHPYSPATTDLVFKIEFCETTTAARRHSWGELKVRYR